MKKILISSSVILFLLAGCTKNNQELLDRLAAAEKRIESLEKAQQAQAREYRHGGAYLGRDAR